MPQAFEKLGKFEQDENGFMRVKARFIAHGVMQYAKHELGQFAIPADPEGKIYNIFVDQDTMSDPRAIRSLEGMPVVSDVHSWVDGNNKEVVVGSIAGTPQVNGPYLEGEIVITDPNTIEAIVKGELSDISAGYRNSYVMGQGEHDGIIYDGKQTEIRYNHIALLSPGEGRGGQEVRVLNSKKELKMPDFTAVQLGNTGQSVRVANEDVITFNNYMTESQRLGTENAKNTATLEETINALEEARKVGAENAAQVEELTGQLAATKEQLENAMNPEVIEETANNIVQERDEAKKLIAENMGEKDDEKTANSIKGLSGHALRLKVVNSIRSFNKQDALEGDNAGEGMVQGYYNAYVDMPAPDKARKKVVNGAGVAQTSNANASVSRKTGTAALGYPTKKEA